MRRREFSLLLSGATLLRAEAKLDDPILLAMREELQRSLKLSIAGEAPYYIEYGLEEGRTYNASASLGGLLTSRIAEYRVPRVQVRVGSYEFDNTNCVYTGMTRGSRFDSDTWPVEGDRNQLRQDLWLATDRAYKGAVETISLKRALLKNMNQAEKLNDFAKQAPATVILPVIRPKFDQKLGDERIRRLSAVLTAFPKIFDSRVEHQEGYSTAYYANTEGTLIRMPENLVTIRVRAEALASDGTPLRDHLEWHATDAASLPPETEMRRAIEAMAKTLSASVDAPMGEIYTGPVLFSAQAASQLLAQVLGENLSLMRPPVAEPGRPVNLPPSEFEGRIGSRVLPEFFDVVDDPQARDGQGRRMFGCYEADMEGVIPQPLKLIERGTLKTLLMTRQPVRGAEGSNGRARLPGAFGARSAVPSNLLVRASQTTPAGELKAKLMELVKQRGKPYGVIIEKLDFPSSAGMGELRRMISGAQAGGGARPIALPLVAYRIYPDGRQEMVRGMRFRGLNARALRDILMAGDDSHKLDYQANSYPLSVMGARGFVASVSVLAPSLLFDELDLDRPQEERPRLPIVPPPPAESES